MIMAQTGHDIKSIKTEKQLKQGYTLVEAVVSVVMISVATLGTISYYNSAHKIDYLSMHKRVAAEIANSKMEVIKNNKYAALPNPAANLVWENANVNTGTPPAYFSYFGTKPVTRMVTVNDIIDGSTGTTAYKEVKVKVTWTETNEATAKNVELSTYISP